VHGWVDGGGGGGRGDFEVDDGVLEPGGVRAWWLVWLVVGRAAGCVWGSVGGGGGVECLWAVPLPEPPHALLEIASRLELRVCYRRHRDERQRVADERPEVFGEAAEGVIAALDGVLFLSA